VIETRKLAKAFGLKPVLRGVDLTVEPGQLTVLLGPNGAGKTTLLRILATLSRPTAGQVRVAGWPLPSGAAEARQRLGVVLHHPLLYGDLTAEENLRFYARLYGLDRPAERIEEELIQAGLTARRHDLVRTYSRGMQQRLAIARASLHGPSVWLLDEPYTGLDLAASDRLDERLRAAARRGSAVLMTTHDLARGLPLADRVLILARGVIAFAGRRGEFDPTEFTRTYASVVRA
jgi:heme exporter protein A